MAYTDEDFGDGIVDTICTGCDLPAVVNDLHLCQDCFAKLERDLIRARDWDYSGTAFMTPDEDLEELRLRVISEYGANYELIAPPDKTELRRNPPRRKAMPLPYPQVEPRPAGSYTETDVLDSLERILAATRSYVWRDLQEVAPLLRQEYPDLNPKAYEHKNLLRMLQAHPKRFQTHRDGSKHKKGTHTYVRLSRDHTKTRGVEN
ncbi:MAG TPA: OST-HTH/LOTUS domain-containing protein [Aggregatilineaceae bacterium]|nr:OST-HTH/LOTUS domain-containing protein [Aggregatilineaceae bacterium]